MTIPAVQMQPRGLEMALNEVITVAMGHSEAQTIIYIDLRDDNPTKQRSYSLKEMLSICRLSSTSHFEKTQDAKFGGFWKADNDGVKGARPRFHFEHVEYMVAVINGLMTEAEAIDLWNLRKGMIRDELTSRAISLTTRRKKKDA